MADVKISELPAAVSVAQADTVAIVQGGVTKKATVSLVAPLLANVMTLDGTQTVTGAKTFGTISDLGTPGAGVITNCTGSPTLTAPLLGTPASGVLTNCTGTASALNIGGAAASISVTGQTGKVTVVGLASTNRVKTVRDAADTILELGGSYSPSGNWTNMTLVTPALGTPTAGVLSSCTGFPTRAIGVTWDGGGSAVSTGKAKGYYTAPSTGTIAGWSISADTGTCTIDVWKVAAGTAVPTVANKITTSGVALATGTHIRSTDVSDFGANTAIAVGDVIAYNLTTTSGPTQITFELEITK